MDQGDGPLRQFEIETSRTKRNEISKIEIGRNLAVTARSARTFAHVSFRATSAPSSRSILSTRKKLRQ